VRFTTRAALDARFGADRLLEMVRQPDGTFDEARIDLAIADAEAEVLSYLSGRYPTELPTTPATSPAVIKMAVGEVFLYRLRRATARAASDQEIAAYDATVRWLRDVQAGRANLDLAGAPATDVSRPDILMARGAADQVFGAGGLDDW
jgi:phage gp36-like protein